MDTETPYDFDVTDDVMDAPDGAVLFVETYQAVYERSGDQWVRLGDETCSYPFPGVSIVTTLDGHEVDVEIPRCASRKYEHGRVKCRCMKVAGHPWSLLQGGHLNIGAGRRW